MNGFINPNRITYDDQKNNRRKNLNEKNNFLDIIGHFRFYLKRSADFSRKCAGG
jgi:hypothetical protein